MPGLRGVATGRGLGEEEAAQAETIYLEHQEQLGREASSAALQGQVRPRNGCLVRTQPAVPAPAPCFPAALESSPSFLTRVIVSRSPVLVPCSAACPSGLPHQTAGFTCSWKYSTAQSFTVRPGRQACASFPRDGNREVISGLSRATQSRT